MSDVPTVRHRLRHIRASTRGLDLIAYRDNPEKRAAVERWVEIISEASRHIPAELKAHHPNIPWRQIAEAGNLLRHGYDKVWPERTWELIESDLEPLRLAALDLYDRVREPKDPNPPE